MVEEKKEEKSLTPSEDETIVVCISDKTKKKNPNATYHDLAERDEDGNSPSIGDKPIEVKKTTFIAQHVAGGDLKQITKPSGDVITIADRKKKKEEDKKKEDERLKKEDVKK